MKTRKQKLDAARRQAIRQAKLSVCPSGYVQASAEHGDVMEYGEPHGIDELTAEWVDGLKLAFSYSNFDGDELKRFEEVLVRLRSVLSSPEAAVIEGEIRKRRVELGEVVGS